jgi:hypothetical protein
LKVIEAMEVEALALETRGSKSSAAAVTEEFLERKKAAEAGSSLRG